MIKLQAEIDSLKSSQDTTAAEQHEKQQAEKEEAARKIEELETQLESQKQEHEALIAAQLEQHNT